MKRLDTIKKALYRYFVPFLMLYASSLNASGYDDDVLEIFSKMLPRFVLMSNQKNLLKERLEICILNDKIDEKNALILMSKIDTNYPNGIKNYKIRLVEGDYANVNVCRNSQLIFMFDSTDENIAKAIRYSKENHVLSMSYDAKYLENGVGASLFLGRKVVPYININALHKNGVEFDNLLVQISKIYASEEVR